MDHTYLSLSVELYPASFHIWVILSLLRKITEVESEDNFEVVKQEVEEVVDGLGIGG